MNCKYLHSARTHGERTVSNRGHELANFYHGKSNFRIPSVGAWERKSEGGEDRGEREGRRDRGNLKYQVQDHAAERTA